MIEMFLKNTRLNTLILVAILTAISTASVCDAKSNKWKFFTKIKYNASQDIIYLNQKDIKKHKNLLHFEVYRDNMVLSANKETANLNGYFDKVADTIISNNFPAADLTQAKLSYAVDCESKKIQNLSRYYYQKNEPPLIIDNNNKVISYQGAKENFTSDMSYLIGWKSFDRFSEYMPIYDKHCKAQYKHKDLKKKIIIE